MLKTSKNILFTLLVNFSKKNLETEEKCCIFAV